MDLQNCTPLEYLVEKHPDWRWDMRGLSENPSITPEFVKLHPEMEWDMFLLSGNPSITLEFVKLHPKIGATREYFSTKLTLHLAIDNTR